MLIAEERITARVRELAAQISRDYANASEVLLIGVLRGAFVFLADLSRRLTIPCRVDFIAVSRYEDGAVPGAVRLVMDVRTGLTGRHVLLVEDIVDSGETLGYLLDMLRARGPASLRTCVLTRRPGPLAPGLTLEYVGFEIPDRWVVGYGLDHADRWRTLPYIGILPDPAPGT